MIRRNFCIGVVTILILTPSAFSQSNGASSKITKKGTKGGVITAEGTYDPAGLPAANYQFQYKKVGDTKWTKGTTNFNPTFKTWDGETPKLAAGSYKIRFFFTVNVNGNNVPAGSIEEADVVVSDEGDLGDPGEGGGGCPPPPPPFVEEPRLEVFAWLRRLGIEC